MARIIDNIIALRIIYLLTVPFEKTDAFKLGLIDANGKQLKKAETSEEKNATSMLHRLVWNIKKVFALAPGGKTRLGSLAAAYLLVKESHQAGHTEREALLYFNENFDRVYGLPFEERELVIDAFEALTEDAVANVTGDGVQTNNEMPLSGQKKKPKIVRRFGEFPVDDETFSKFKSGKETRRWANYLNMEDASHKQIYDFAKKNPDGVIVLTDSSGNKRGIRYSKRGKTSWANVKRKPSTLGESVYTEVEFLIEDLN